MELVYLWVEDYKNIKRQGFNFSPKFHCNYDPDTNELTIEKNDDYIENFFGDNINVTAIVGKNGSGKSSVAEMILSKVPKWKHKKYILIGRSKINGEERYHSWGNIKDINLDGIDSLTTSDIDLGASGVEIGARDNKNVSHNLFYLNGKEFNFRLLDNEVEYSDGDDNIFIPKYIYQCRNNLKVFTSKHFFYKFDKVRFYLKPLDKDKIIEDIMNIDNLKENLSVNEYIQSLDSKDIFCTNFLILFIRYSLLNLIEHTDFLENIKQIKSCFDITNENFNSVPNITDIVKSLNFLKTLDLKNETTNQDSEKKYYYEVEINNEGINCLWIFEYILDLNALYKENLPLLKIDLYDSNRGLSYSELSQGEKQYIRLLIEVISNKGAGDLSVSIEPRVYIFDEIETSLHPQWQKNILNDIINIFNIWENKKAHLIFLTHSPFLLSDIPKQNIIFLDTDENGNCKVVDGLKEKKETFGANIHTLLSDSFFMEDGLMGEFAKSKIDEVIKLLNKEHLEPNEIKHCEQIISIIGEPIIKNKLQKMLDSKRLKKIDKIDDIEKSIQALQEELEKLKNAKS